MKIKEFLCVGSLAASILTAGCSGGESPITPDSQIEEINKPSELKIEESIPEPIIELLPKVRIPEKFSGKSFRRPVRIFYVEDHGTIHSDEVEDWIWNEVEKSRKFFAKEMDRHGYGERTFEISNGKIERIYEDKITYLKDYDNRNPEVPCYEHAHPLKERLLNQTNNPEVEEIHVYIINFQLKCFEGIATDFSSFFDNNILIDAFDNDNLYEIIAHEIGHIYSLVHDERDHSIMKVPYLPEQEGMYKLYEDQAKKINRLSEVLQ